MSAYSRRFIATSAIITMSNRRQGVQQWVLSLSGTLNIGPKTWLLLLSPSRTERKEILLLDETVAK